jgi:NADPH-dependent 2,4-dienoyl-CoA reductase/sulfur reductase-like enzyme
VDENAAIVVFERGYYVSYANCGLPYFAGNVNDCESKLLLASPDLFRERFRIEVRVRNEAIGIDRRSRCVVVRDVDNGSEYRESYEALVLSPGAAPVRPAWPGIELPGIYALRTLAGSEDIRDWIETPGARRAVVVRGGFIGLEMAENLVRRGMEVTIVEAADQLMPLLDAEMAEYVRRQVAGHVARLPGRRRARVCGGRRMTWRGRRRIRCACGDRGLPGCRGRRCMCIPGATPDIIRAQRRST